MPFVFFHLLPIAVLPPKKQEEDGGVRWNCVSNFFDPRSGNRAFLHQLKSAKDLC
jgi:hypothetical protein